MSVTSCRDVSSSVNVVWCLSLYVVPFGRAGCLVCVCILLIPPRKWLQRVIVNVFGIPRHDTIRPESICRFCLLHFGCRLAMSVLLF